MNLFNLEALTANELACLTVILLMVSCVLTLLFILRELRRPIERTEMTNARFTNDQKENLTSDTTQMKVLQVRSLSKSVKNFRLKPLNHFIDYRPGQFLTFHLGPEGKTKRCYSLNSSPATRGTYDVSVKLLENGKGSTWMHEKVQSGDVLKVNWPSGRFYYTEKTKISIFVAGGIGITPMLSMLQYLVDTGSEKPLFFFYAAKTSDELVFFEQLKYLSDQAPNITLNCILSQPDENWTGLKGRLNKDILKSFNIDFSQSDLYTCGPTPLMDSVKNIAFELGLKEEHFHNEVFASPTSSQREKRQCSIHLKQSQKNLQYDSNLPLLNFLERQKVDINSSCRSGVCGTCEITLIKGEVESLKSDFLSEEDLKQGKKLSCISFPKSDLEIDL